MNELENMDFKSYYYAQLNEKDYCIAISSLSGEVISDNLIQLSDFDTSYLNRKYDRETDTWTDEYMSVPDVPQKVTLESIKSDTAPIKETTTLTADDALTIMEYQTILDEKLNKIIVHLGL